MASSPPLNLPPLPSNANSGSLTPITGAIQVRGAGTDAGAGGGGTGLGTDAVGAGDARASYSGGGAGGKARSSRRASLARSKKTPYARPASGRHATAGGVAAAAAAASSSSSIASRLVDSASRLFSSSASYLFSSVFGRRPPLAIANGDVPPAGVSAAEEELEEDLVEAPVDQAGKHDASPDQALVLVGDSSGAEKREMDLVQVEQILKHQTWSREQVNRLTEILQTRVLENNTIRPKSEAQRWREELKKARDDATPIEVARAYMGERTARPSSLAASIHGSAHQIDRVAELQPPPGLGLLEDRYRASPVVRTWARSTGAVRTPKRSTVLDDEWASVGPIRRTRQKSLMLANSSPYARGVTGSSVPSRTFTSPPIQSSQTARKILETLEKLTPSPKGKSLEGELNIATEGLPSELATDVLKLREKKSLQISESSRLPKMTEPGPSSGKLTAEPPVLIDSRAVEKSVTRSPPLMVGSPTVIPERSKGFRMSAVFEESNSDEENRLNSRIFSLPSTEAQLPILLSETREAPQLSSLSSVKPSSVPAVATSAPATASTDVSVFTAKSLPTMTAQMNVLPEPTLTFSTTIKSSSSPAVQSSGTAAMSLPASFTFAGQSGSSSAGQFFTTGALSTSSRGNVFSVVNGDASIASAAVVASATVLSTTAAPPAVPASPAAGAPFAGDSLLPVAAAPTGVSLDSATAIEDLSEGENGTIMATEGPGADKLVDADIMAADPMAEEPDTFAMSSSPPVFTFGSSSAATSVSSIPKFTFGSSSPVTSTSPVPAFTFGASGVSSPSPSFSFAVQSSGTATTLSSAGYTFGGQSGTSSSAGPLFTFGAPLTPLPASPFSLSRASNSTPTFTFGSSPAAVSSAPPTFPATSSALPSFSVSSSAAHTFSFGPHAASSPLSSSSSAGQMFGFGASPTANPFSTAGAANSSPAFTFSSSPAAVSSAAPAFSFGGGAGTSPSVSSFAGQSYAFGAQHPAAASPFSPAGTPNSTPAFQFATSSAVSEMPSLLFGSTATSSTSPTFAFGAQSAVSPVSSAPFTFGGQTGAASAVQPFPFGGQPTGPAQSIFSSPGASNTFPQATLEFAGGFALGATGGEKSGRKYIKAKRKK